MAIVKSSGPLSCKVGGNSTVGIQIRIHPIVLLEGIREIELTADLSGGIGGPDIPPDNM